MFGFLRGMFCNNAAPKSAITIYHPFSFAWGSRNSQVFQASSDEELLDEITPELLDVLEHMQEGRVDDAISLMEFILLRVIDDAVEVE